MINTITTSSSCSKPEADDQNNVTYTCTVTVRARCEVVTKGKSLTETQPKIEPTMREASNRSSMTYGAIRVV